MPCEATIQIQLSEKKTVPKDQLTLIKSNTNDAINMLSNFTSSFSRTSLRLPREQYSVMIQMLGGSVQAPINAFRLS